MPCVRPFHAPITPPVPPSSGPSGRPTRTLMFCSADVPYSTSTWQYGTLLPAPGTTVASTVLMPGLPTSPPAAPASCAHNRGGDAASAWVEGSRPIATSNAAAGEMCRGMGSPVRLIYEGVRLPAEGSAQRPPAPLHCLPRWKSCRNRSECPCRQAMLLSPGALLAGGNLNSPITRVLNRIKASTQCAKPLCRPDGQPAELPPRAQPPR